MERFHDHFSAVAGAYAAFRPGYPEALIGFLAAAAPGRELAWDAATGSGQAALLLAEQFRRVRATDASAAQVAAAVRHPRVDYAVAAEADSGLAEATVDLVTVAQALHWFDLARFYPEAHRVLKPGGVLAVWSYAHLSVSPEVDRVVGAFYSERIGAYWPPERRHVETAYRELPFPYPEEPITEFFIEARLDRNALVNYIGTWSAVQEGRRRESGDPLLDLLAPLEAAWPDGTKPRPVRWPLAVRWGRRPPGP